MKQLALLAALCVAPLLVKGTPANAEEIAAQSRVLVQNWYYPKPGQEGAVLATRLEASNVRKQLGLAVGRVLLRVSDEDGGPLVIWECEYPTLAARESDSAAAVGTKEFSAVQAKMRGFIERFERKTWELRNP